MTRIILSGACGKMGQSVVGLLRQREDCRIVAGLDISTPSLATTDFPLYNLPKLIEPPADVLIDFSHPSLLTDLLSFLKERSLPAVIATTGLSKPQIDEIHRASKEIPLFFSANMSLGVNLLLRLSQMAVKVLGPSFDIEIVEKHHSAKLDAPSGTALMLADGISEQCTEHMQYTYDRHSRRAPRQKSEIGIHSIRGGTIVGEHDVLFSGPDEMLTLSHSATSKGVFATGALSAALFLVGQKPGLYDMGDLVKAGGSAEI